METFTERVDEVVDLFDLAIAGIEDNVRVEHSHRSEANAGETRRLFLRGPVLADLDASGARRVPCDAPISGADVPVEWRAYCLFSSGLVENVASANPTPVAARCWRSNICRKIIHNARWAISATPTTP